MINVEKRGDELIIDANQQVSLWTLPRHIVRRIWSHFRDLWDYRELLRNLILRDLKVRYRNSLLGMLWSLGNPLLMMVVFTAVFTVITPYSDVEKYPVFVLCGILPWNFFSSSVVGSIRSIVDNSQLVSKVYFPREILPISLVLANLVNFLLALIVLFVFILIFQVSITVWILLLPLVILMQVIFTLGIALMLATANVFYRDMQVIMEVLMLAWFFLTPVFYSASVMPSDAQLFGMTIDVARWVRILNPMASIIENYRIILYGQGSGGAPPEIFFFMRTLVTVVAVFGVGAFLFYRSSHSFAEEI